MEPLTGKVVAMVCRGGEADRAIAVALAEAGADIALGTVSRSRDEEFATASIANEIWAIGREQFNTVLDAADPADAAAFAGETCDRLGRCDAVVIAPGAAPRIDWDQLSRDEWEPLLAEGLTAPVIAAQAFARVMERAGGGVVVLIDDDPGPLNLPGAVVNEATRAFAAQLGLAWQSRPLRALFVSREAAARQLTDILK